jgi:hypothetical protein
MLSHDNKPEDFNPKITNNVYLDGSKSTYAGHCVQCNNGDGLIRLDATGKGETFSITVDGDKRTVRHLTETPGKEGKAPSFHEEWAIFDGSQVKYKAINY